jgi:hypothetical protein
MTTQETQTIGGYEPAAFKKSLGYQWVAPPKSHPLDWTPYWIKGEDDDPLETLVDNLAKEEWKVAFIRDQIRRLGVKPKGRARVTLLRQLLEGFLDPERLAQRLAGLSDEERRSYTYLLLYRNLESLQTDPTQVKEVFGTSRSREVLTQSILDAGLALENETRQAFIPTMLYKLLPPCHLDLPTAPDPETVVPAAPPQILMLNLQRLLSLIQEDRYNLRQRLRWTMPNVGYMSRNQIWPPAPEDAEHLADNLNQRHTLTLCPPQPMPDASAMDTWASELGVPPQTVEFLYHAAVYLGLILPGNPVKLNDALIQKWLVQPLGRQIVLMYVAFRNVSNWTPWEPLWRRGQITVQWDYQHYWGISAIDDVIRTTYYMQRWVLLDVLAHLPHDAWISVREVDSLLHRLYPSEDTQRYQRNLHLRHGDDWHGALHLALISTLRDVLYPLGLVDLAPSREQPTLFRLHDLQDVHWGRTTRLAIASSRTLSEDTVQFDAESEMLTVQPPAQAEFLAFVQRWAKPAGLVQDVLRYQLDVRRLYQAFERGETPETLAATWLENADFPPLPNVEAWWQTWWDRYGHIRLYPQQATLMTRDTFTMQEVQVALPSLRGAILGLVTPRTALLQPDQVDEILEGLERQGYMPKEA